MARRTRAGPDLLACRYELPPESAKAAQPSLEQPLEQWQAVLSQQGAEVPVTDCMLRAYQVCGVYLSAIALTGVCAAWTCEAVLQAVGTKPGKLPDVVG